MADSHSTCARGIFCTFLCERWARNRCLLLNYKTNKPSLCCFCIEMYRPSSEKVSSKFHICPWLCLGQTFTSLKLFHSLGPVLISQYKKHREGLFTIYIIPPHLLLNFFHFICFIQVTHDIFLSKADKTMLTWKSATATFLRKILYWLTSLVQLHKCHLPATFNILLSTAKFIGYL